MILSPFHLSKAEAETLIIPSNFMSCPRDTGRVAPIPDISIWLDGNTVKMFESPHIKTFKQGDDGSVVVVDHNEQNNTTSEVARLKQNDTIFVDGRDYFGQPFNKKVGAYVVDVFTRSAGRFTSVLSGNISCAK